MPRFLLHTALALSCCWRLAETLRAKEKSQVKKAKQVAQSSAQTELWRPCGSEGEVIPSAGLVRFGWGLTWVESNVPRGASCSSTSFGSDPAPGILKMCECAGEESEALQAKGEVKDDMGMVWKRCASEGDKCQCESGTVRFGNNARWVVTERGPASAAVECNVKGFDGHDPAVGQDKECWCEMSSPKSAADPGVAIVLLTRRALDLKTWLVYHLHYMGVKHVFMSVEDSPAFDAAFKSLKKEDADRVTVWKAEAPSTQKDNRPEDDYTTLQARQLAAMRRAKDASKEMGIEWLLHIDDDELLYAPLHKPIGEILATVPTGYDQAYLPNVEAIYKNAEVGNCFLETASVNMNRYTFVSYANGKAAVRVTDADAVPAGPHQWRTPDGVELPSIHLDAETFGSPVWLVHFESCPFSRWEDKYYELGNTSPDKVQAIPFPFYKESITRMQHCRAVEGRDDPKCSQSRLKKLWSHWKTPDNPSIKRGDLMPITIPWNQILQGA